MSLKAYDGMMTTKGFSYLQNKIKEHMDEFFEVSKEAMLNHYVSYIINFVDYDIDLHDRFMSECNEVSIKREIESRSRYDSTIIGTIMRNSKILGKSSMRNEASVDLILRIEDIGNKLLVYPNTCVKEHKKILLKFLDDWYAQNQVDPDEDVPEDEWKERCKDWWEFNETNGFEMRIHIFDPDHYWNNFTNLLRNKTSVIDEVIKRLPTDEDRMLKKASKILFDERYNAAPKPTKFEVGLAMKISKELHKDDKKILRDYIKTNPISVTKIDEEFLKSEYTPKLSDDEESVD